MECQFCGCRDIRCDIVVDQRYNGFYIIEGAYLYCQNCQRIVAQDTEKKIIFLDSPDIPKKEEDEPPD